MILAVSTVELGLRMVVSLGVFLGIAWAVTRSARARGGPGRSRPELRVHARHQLSRSASVALLQAGERHLLVGVTDNGVTLLAEGDDLMTAGGDDGDDAGPVERAGPGPRPGDILDLRPGDLVAAADGIRKRVAGKRHGGAAGPAPTRTSVIDALRERTVRRL